MKWEKDIQKVNSRHRKLVCYPGTVSTCQLYSLGSKNFWVSTTTLVLQCGHSRKEKQVPISDRRMNDW